MSPLYFFQVKLENVYVVTGDVTDVATAVWSMYDVTLMNSTNTSAATVYDAGGTYSTTLGGPYYKVGNIVVSQADSLKSEKPWKEATTTTTTTKTVSAGAYLGSLTRRH